MEYSGLTVTDYSNVRSLNVAFLSVLRARIDGANLRRCLAEPIAGLVAAITDLQLQRLAGCPFLLMSFRETDRTFWEDLAGDDPVGDLLRAPPPAALARLVTAGLAFLWQLARRDTYAVRVVSGGDTGFCDRLTGLTLVRMLNRTAERGDLVVPRFADEAIVWSKLLGPGISSTPGVRHAAQLSVLQSMLTAPSVEGRAALRAAACASSPPARRVVDRERHR